MKLKPFISGFIIWIIFLSIRLIYLAILKNSVLSLNKFFYAFKLSLFFFSPVLVIIILMQYLEIKYILLKKNNFIYTMFCFGMLGILYFGLAYDNKSNYNSEVFLESVYSLIAGLIYYLFNNYHTNK